MSGSIQVKCNSLANHACVCDFASRPWYIAHFLGKVKWAPEMSRHRATDWTAQPIRALGIVGIR